MFRGKFVAVTGAALVLAGVTACGSDRQEATAASVTDPALKKSDTATKFLVDLYNSPSGDYWKQRPQQAVYYQATIFCSSIGSEADVRGNFDGASADAIKDYTRLAKADVCTAIDANGGLVPGFQPSS